MEPAKIFSSLLYLSFGGLDQVEFQPPVSFFLVGISPVTKKRDMNVNGEGFLIVPRAFIRRLGATESIVFIEILTRSKFMGEKGLLFFPCPMKELERSTGLSYFKISQAIEKIQDVGFLRTKRMGKDGSLHLKIVWARLEKIIGEQSVTSGFSNNSKTQNTSNKKYHIGNSSEGKEKQQKNRDWVFEFFEKGFLSDLKTHIYNKDGDNKLSPSRAISEKSHSPSSDGRAKNHAEEILSHWNHLPHVPKHKNPSTKVYASSIRIIRRLMSRGIHEGLDPEFLRKHSIPKKWITQTWKKVEIMEGLEEMAKLFHPDYEPITKTMSKNLPHLIYNPITQTSMFLRAKANPPKTLMKKFAVSRNPMVRKISNLLQQNLYQGKALDLDLPILNRIGKEISQYHREVKTDEWGEVEAITPTPLALADQYIRWIQEKERIPAPFALLPSSGSFWSWFIQELQENLGVDFRTGREYVKRGGGQED